MDPVFLLLGPERGDKSRFIKDITRRISKEYGEPPEVHRIYAFDAQLPDLLSLLRNGSLFAQHRLVILNDVDQIKKKDELALLLDYIKSPSPASTLLLVSDSPAINSVSRSVVKAVAKGAQKIFWEMFENRKLGWIRSYFDKRDIRIDTEAGRFLLEMIENNTSDLEQECEKLAFFFGPGTELQVDTISQYIYQSREESVFTLFERMAGRNFTASQETLNNILLSRSADPSSLMGGLLWQIRKLIDLKRLLKQNYSPEEAFTRIDIRGKKRRSMYLAADRVYTLQEARALVALVAEFEMRLRSCKADLHPILLQLFLYYAVVKGGRIPSAVLC